MSRDELAVRKQLLVAQSGLYRAQLRYQAVTLRARAWHASGWIGRGITLVRVARVAISIVAFLRK